jgi:small subunit ribosomal protein S11
MAKASSAKKVKKRKVIITPEGLVFVHASFNNIIVSVTNKTGQVISWGSAGKAGFRGSKKNTPYAAQVAATDASKVAYDAGMRTAEVYVRGPGSGREAAIRAVDAAGIKVTIIRDMTPMPHNGCRPPKRRRV